MRDTLAVSRSDLRPVRSEIGHMIRYTLIPLHLDVTSMDSNNTAYMLDTMVVDHIIHGDVNISVEDLVESDINLTFTYLLRDEVAASDDFEQKVENYLNDTNAERITRPSSLYNIGRYGCGAYDSTKLSRALRGALRAEKVGDRKDALMIETALRNGDIFVTEEKRILNPPESYPDEISSEQIISEREFIERIHERMTS